MFKSNKKLALPMLEPRSNLATSLTVLKSHPDEKTNVYILLNISKGSLLFEAHIENYQSGRRVKAQQCQWLMTSNSVI